MGRAEVTSLSEPLPPTDAAAASPESAAFHIIERKPAVVLLIDCSNPMAGAKLSAAKALGLQLVGSLREEQRFTLVAFGAGVLAFDTVLHEASIKAKDLAAKFLNCLGLLGDPNLDHALKRAMRLSAPLDAEIVLLTAHSPPSLNEVTRQARESARRLHIVEYGGCQDSPCNELATSTGGNFVVMPLPAELPAMPIEPLPRRYVCHGTALLRLKRPEAPCSPAWLSQQLAQDRPAEELLSQWKEIFPDLHAALTTLLGQGFDATTLLTCFKQVLNHLQTIGGISWLRLEADHEPSFDQLLYLELRVIAIDCCRDWCHQELVFNPPYDPRSLPDFLQPSCRH